MSFLLTFDPLDSILGEEVAAGVNFISGVTGEPGDPGPNRGVKELASSTWVVSKKEVEKFGMPH